MPPAELRAAFRKAGFKPSRSLGQNFLTDPNLNAAIARHTRADTRSLVLEVGPGAGHLTAKLLETGAAVLAVEIDRRLVELCRDCFAETIASGRLFILESDFLHRGAVSPAVLEKLEEMRRLLRPSRILLAGNLPYSAASQIIAAALASPADFSSLVVTVQKEVGERLCAAAGSSHYGSLTAFVSAFAEVRMLRRISRSVFWPKPKVDSVLLEIVPRVKGDEIPAGFGSFLKALFSKRRKKLRNALEHPKAPCILQAAGIDGNKRPGEIPPGGLLELFRVTTRS